MEGIAEADDTAAAIARLRAALGAVQPVAPDARNLGPLIREALHIVGGPPRTAPPQPLDPALRPLLAPFTQLGMLEDVAAAEPFLAVPDAVLGRIRDGQGLVVFDCGNEGRALVPRHVATLHGLLDRHGIPPARAVWAQQNRALEAPYRALCAERGWAPMHIVVAHSHATGLWRRLVLGRGRGLNWAFGFAARAAGERRHRWVCLNYNLRAPRALIVARLLASGAPGFLSFSVTRETHGREADARLLESAAALWPLAPARARAEVEALLASGIHHGSDVDGFAHPNERIYSLPVDAVAAAELFVVTETEMDGRGLVRWTEKTLKALASGLPFVVFGNAGAVRALRGLGFDLLDDLVDHAYDAQPDPARRFAAAEAAVMRFLARPPGFTAAEHARLCEAAAHNESVFRSRLIADAAFAPVARILDLAAAG